MPSRSRDPAQRAAFDPDIRVAANIYIANSRRPSRRSRCLPVRPIRSAVRQHRRHVRCGDRPLGRSSSRKYTFTAADELRIKGLRESLPRRGIGALRGGCHRSSEASRSHRTWKVPVTAQHMTSPGEPTEGRLNGHIDIYPHSNRARSIRGQQVPLGGSQRGNHHRLSDPEGVQQRVRRLNGAYFDQSRSAPWSGALSSWPEFLVVFIPRDPSAAEPSCWSNAKQYHDARPFSSSGGSPTTREVSRCPCSCTTALENITSIRRARTRR